LTRRASRKVSPLPNKASIASSAPIFAALELAHRVVEDFRGPRH
jgi:hypothetical protein